jgi:hypothetical protein
MLKEKPVNKFENVGRRIEIFNSQQINSEHKSVEAVNDILDSLVGILPETGKTLEQYREERIRERYESRTL